MDFIDTISSLWSSFDFGLAFLVFLAYLIVDAMYAQYTLHIAQYREYSAATIGAMMHFALAFGMISYVQNFLYVIPIAADSWLETFYCCAAQSAQASSKHV